MCRFRGKTVLSRLRIDPRTAPNWTAARWMSLYVAGGRQLSTVYKQQFAPAPTQSKNAFTQRALHSLSKFRFALQLTKFIYLRLYNKTINKLKAWSNWHSLSTNVHKYVCHKTQKWKCCNTWFPLNRLIFHYFLQFSEFIGQNFPFESCMRLIFFNELVLVVKWKCLAK